jgi:cell wall assembly regulator SMI1
LFDHFDGQPAVSKGVGELLRVEPLDGGVQAWIRVTVEIEGEAKPGCVADTISRYYF